MKFRTIFITQNKSILNHKNSSKLFKVEIIAKSLFKELSSNLKKGKVIIEGAGVRWNCIVEYQNCEVKIYNCDNSYQKDENDEEFIISFFLNMKQVSCGRTYNRKDVIKSTNNWISNKSKELLYENFIFIDKGLRQIKTLEQNWFELYPELKEIERNITNRGSGFFEYKIQNENKFCFFRTFGNEIFCTFGWNDCFLFETQPELDEFGIVLKKYLIENILPSELNSDYNGF